MKPSTKTISIRLPESLIAHLKVLANKKDVPYQSLLNSIANAFGLTAEEIIQLAAEVKASLAQKTAEHIGSQRETETPLLGKSKTIYQDALQNISEGAKSIWLKTDKSAIRDGLVSALAKSMSKKKPKK